MSNPQEVQFGKQPPKNPDVEYGKSPQTAETTTSTPGQDDPSLVGVVPVYAGGDAVPTNDEDASDASESDGGDAETSDASDASQTSPTDDEA